MSKIPTQNSKLLLSFLHLDCVNVGFAKKIGSKNNPFPVWRKGDVRLEAVIVCSQVDKPFSIFAGLDDEAGKPEFLSFGCLQVIPDGFAVGVEELVAGDLHLHRS